MAFLSASQAQAKQVVFPGASILNIDKSGLITIEFNTTMKVPEHPDEIKSGEVFVNGTMYPAVLVSVLPSKSSDISSLGFNWTFVEFT